jgi:hypothetical protein
MPAQFVYSLPWAQIRCRRVGAASYPRIEVVAQSFVRTNSHALSPTSGFLAATVAADDSDLFSVFTSTPTNAVVTATGNIDQHVAGPQATLKSGRYSLRGSPADRYDGSAVIEVSYDDGSTYLPLVGAQLPPSVLPAGAGELDHWRIGNGLFRIGFDGSGFHAMSVFNGSTWESSSFRIIDGTNGALFVEGSVIPAVLTNSPNRCTISLTYGAVVATVTVVRGLRMSFWTFATPGTTYKWGAQTPTAEAATAITGGLRRTSNDANGNRWVYLCPVAATSDTVNGKHYQTTATATGSLGIGLEFDGSTSTGNDTVTVLRDSYYLPALVDERIVTR